MTSHKSSTLRIAVMEKDPLRFVGFRVLLEPEIELVPISSCEVLDPGIRVVLLSGPVEPLAALMERWRAALPELRLLIIGAENNDGAILKTIAYGGKGYIQESAPRDEILQAIRVVHEGGLWAPRRILAQVIERSGEVLGRNDSMRELTAREKQVLGMLVEGRSNKEIAVPLGIEERTVKAHVAKLMRKAGVQNRIALSVHAITHSLVPTQ